MFYDYNKKKGKGVHPCRFLLEISNSSDEVTIHQNRRGWLRIKGNSFSDEVFPQAKLF